MKRPWRLLSVGAVALVGLGFAAGFAVANRRARVDLAYTSVGTSLDKTSTIQLTLTMLEKQRADRLLPILEERLVTAIGSAHRAISTYGLPPFLAVPNLTESMRRAGSYLQRRGIHPEAVRQAEWVVARLSVRRD